MPTKEELYQVLVSEMPEFKDVPIDQALALASEEMPEFTVDLQAPAQSTSNQPSYAESAARGLMQEPMPPGASLGRRVAHGVAAQALPVIGAAAGTPAGPAGMAAGAMAGRGMQKAAQAGARALTGQPQPERETPLRIAGDVATMGASEAMGGALVRGVAKAAGGAAKVARAMSVDEMNSLLKPKTVQYLYGKNPGKAVLDEGITGRSFAEIQRKVSAKLNEVGTQLEQLMSKPATRAKKIRLTGFLAPIDDAIARAKKAPESNKALITRLEALKRDLLQGKGDMQQIVVSPRQALEMKRTIGDLTPWNTTKEDTVMAAVLKNTYRNVDTRMDRVLPGFKEINDRFSNLLGAHTAAKARVMSNRGTRELMPMLETIGGGVVGAMAGKPVTGLLTGAGVAAAHKAAGSPLVRSHLAQGLKNYAVPASQATVRGVMSAAESGLPQGAMRGMVGDDPLGLFD